MLFLTYDGNDDNNDEGVYYTFHTAHIRCIGFTVLHVVVNEPGDLGLLNMSTESNMQSAAWNLALQRPKVPGLNNCQCDSHKTM